jgi:predicted permease
MTGNIWNENVRLDGEDVEWRSANFNRVSEGYFKAIGIPLIEGRDFSDRDSAAGPRVAIVTTAFVKEFVPDGRALGRVVRVQAAPGEPEPAYTVIGVAGDARQAVRDDVESTIYLASAQDADPGGEVGYILRSRGRIEAMRTSVARAIAEVNPEIAIEFTVIERSIRDSLVRERLMAVLSLAFGLVAGLLAAVGLYGVMSYTVARRGNEFGIRLALGAERRTVLWMVLRETFALVALGVVVGMALGLAATTAARGLLFGLKPTDPATFAGAAAILAATGLLAGYLPARRASKTEPTATLRES